MTTCAEWRARLATAEADLQSAQTGGALKSVKAGEKSIEYAAPIGINDKLANVRYLQGKVDACDGVSRANRVLRFTPTDG